jgi:hypothetical protein
VKEFIDKTSVENGTPINRANTMAIQGFIDKTIEFLDDGRILETNSNGETKTTEFMSDGSIVEMFVGQKTIRKKTTFENNKIVEVLY